MTPYVGRFAPSPTGLLHAGSLVAALASWLDARAHAGRWLVRMEDVDLPRCITGADELILGQLAACGMVSDAPVVYQSKRAALYDAALYALPAYRCFCSRSQLQQLGLSIYPGTCRQACVTRFEQLAGFGQRYAWRVRVDDKITIWTDRRLGQQAQNVSREIGDFVVKRADGLFAYQLAVVADDIEQGVTHIVRGADLVSNTARQIELKNSLKATWNKASSSADFLYLHMPLVLAADNEKLSKQNGAKALDISNPLKALNLAAAHLGLGSRQGSIAEALSAWTLAWQSAWRVPT